MAEAKQQKKIYKERLFVNFTGNTGMDVALRLVAWLLFTESIEYLNRRGEK